MISHPLSSFYPHLSFRFIVSLTTLCPSSLLSLTHPLCIIQAEIPAWRAWPLKIHGDAAPSPFSAAFPRRRSTIGWGSEASKERERGGGAGGKWSVSSGGTFPRDKEPLERFKRNPVPREIPLTPKMLFAQGEVLPRSWKTFCDGSHAHGYKNVNLAPHAWLTLIIKLFFSDCLTAWPGDLYMVYAFNVWRLEYAPALL